MTAPNLRSPTSITGKTVLYTCTTTLTEVLANAANSDRVYKITTTRCSNDNPSLTTTVDIAIRRGAVTRYLIKGVGVPATKALIVTDKNEYIYLEEGDSIWALAGTNSDIDLTISYEDIS